MLPKFLVFLALFFVSCSASDGTYTQALSLEGKTMSDLTDEEIQRICSNVHGGTDIECGMHPTSNGPATTVDAPGEQDCLERLREMQKDEYEACSPAQEIADCWMMDPCAREDPEWCEAACPEREACWEHSVDDCEDHDPCEVTRGSKWDAANECYRDEPAYCAPKLRICANAMTTALDDDGTCWLMSSICEVPDGWENEDSAAPSCPAESPPMCP